MINEMKFFTNEEVRKIAEVVDKLNRLAGRNYSSKVSRNRAVIGELIRAGFSVDELVRRATLVLKRWGGNKNVDTGLVAIFTDAASFSPTQKIVSENYSKKFKEYKQRRPYAKLDKPSSD